MGDRPGGGDDHPDVNARAGTEVTVFLVDDQIPFLRAAAAVVGATDGFTVVGCATSGVYAAEQIIERGGELGLVLLDVHLGDLDGPSVRARIAQTWPDLPVAYLSTLDRSDLPDDAWDFPVVEFFSKASFGPEVLRSVLPKLGGPVGGSSLLP